MRKVLSISSLGCLTCHSTRWSGLNVRRLVKTPGIRLQPTSAKFNEIVRIFDLRQKHVRPIRKTSWWGLDARIQNYLLCQLKDKIYLGLYNLVVNYLDPIFFKMKLLLFNLDPKKKLLNAFANFITETSSKIMS